LNLINGYRSRGHLFAKTNPILPNRDYRPTLHHSNFGLTDEDLDLAFTAGNIIGIGKATLRQIINHLEQTYCSSIGAEYKYIRKPEIIEWLESRMESIQNKPNFSPEDKKDILRRIAEASLFESFLHKKFVGQKRFSLEGAEAIIPAMEETIEHGAALGIQEFVIGMAHRGRLNVLTHILRKSYEQVFTEFRGIGISDDMFDGDVKYHMGHSAEPVLQNGKKVHLSLAPNPSHLEAVDPVVCGIARSKIDHLYQGEIKKVCPILIHGDASLAGQGIVYEVLQMSGLDGYKVGGTVHLVINNQIGFTTDSHDSRSSTYCTDVAKVTLCPVFHVNGDDAEAVTYVTKLAMEFRQTFHRDVFIDIVCY
ncbi:MAG: thiamine pyrophosphate-dependent enzyme, partial [Bacteroidia bacterium]|nr:thiamine pyrophosphate-dependent enzyme [Bacteroidia bacterium]